MVRLHIAIPKKQSGRVLKKMLFRKLKFCKASNHNENKEQVKVWVISVESHIRGGLDG